MMCTCSDSGVFAHAGAVSNVHWDNMWKSRGCIMVNRVPRKVSRPKPIGAAGQGFGRGTSLGTPFTMIHPRLFHIFSFFRQTRPVKTDFLHCRQTQHASREYHTQYYIVGRVKSQVTAPACRKKVQCSGCSVHGAVCLLPKMKI